jgi:hypothetical protein
MGVRPHEAVAVDLHFADSRNPEPCFEALVDLPEVDCDSTVEAAWEISTNAATRELDYFDLMLLEFDCYLRILSFGFPNA